MSQLHKNLAGFNFRTVHELGDRTVFSSKQVSSIGTQLKFQLTPLIMSIAFFSAI